MQIIICPGVHPPELTEAFIQTLPPLPVPPLVFPASQPVYSAAHLLTFLRQQLSKSFCPDLSQLPESLPKSDGNLGQMSKTQTLKAVPTLWIGFSAGVVGTIGAAQWWHLWGGQVVALIAFDGWGVPLFAPFPIHRVSHDAFTHWSSSWLGTGEISFYAEPEVAHLELWRSPSQVQGWAVQSSAYTYTTAAQFVTNLIQKYRDKHQEIHTSTSSFSASRFLP